MLGINVHIGVDAESRLVQTVRGTAGNVNNLVDANSFLHGLECDMFADAGYQGEARTHDAKAGVN